MKGIHFFCFGAESASVPSIVLYLIYYNAKFIRADILYYFKHLTKLKQ